MGGAAKRPAELAGLGLLLGLIAVPAPAAWSLDCNKRWLSATELVICADPQLLRLEEQLSRRIKSNAERLSFGQYLGLRHWQAMRASQRNACKTDRDCIATNLRAQAQFLERLQRCATSSLARRACLHSLLADDPGSTRR